MLCIHLFDSYTNINFNFHTVQCCSLGLLGSANGFVSVNLVAQLCPTLCDPMDCSTPVFPVHHQLPELAQTNVHRVGDAIQPSHPMSSPSWSAFNLSQHHGLFQWVSSSHQVAKVLELQDSQESLTPQFKSINSSVLSFLYSRISIHDSWKNHSFD